jgi:hypothetical protein
MGPRVRRRVVSAPLPATPASLQASGPPEAYDEGPDEDNIAIPPRAYLTIPMSHRRVRQFERNFHPDKP